MRIALTHNAKLLACEATAEFDTRETIAAIAALVGTLGHHVTPLDVTGSIANVAAGLARIDPDLVLNLAEGERGAFREAFYPALFEQLGYPHTGSSASVLALCLDKALAKRVVAAAGVAVPAGELVRDRDAVPRVPLPALLKPNLEGSSKGITAASIATSPRQLAPKVGELLDRYPGGVLVEEYIPGDDVAVAWISGVGFLPPIGYRYPATGPFAIYDYALKHETPERVAYEIPFARARTRLADAAARAFAALGVTGPGAYGRADFRVTRDGRVVFLELNPLPALVPGDELYRAAAHAGITARALFASVIDGAAHHARGTPSRAAIA